jgi:heterotetrameric sarcosine oxidase gamma subunit
VSDTGPIARSPIRPPAPVTVEAGWEVSDRRATAALTITDATPLAKLLVRARWDGAMARALGVPFGRAARDSTGALVTGSGPGEWLVLAPPGTAPQVASRLDGIAASVPAAELVTVMDLTHGRAMMRITGPDAPGLLAKVCAVDLGDDATPDGAAFRSSVARLAADVVRDDRSGGRGARSYLLHCERSSGQYLFDALLDAGGEFGIEVDGFTTPGI